MDFASKRPNILLINCDDMGYGDLGCYGSRVNDSPHVDAMARDGILFTDFYAASPVCSPSRGAMMTGCYPSRIGFADFHGKAVLMPGHDIGLNPREITIPKLLKQAGYRTMLVGKWHCGDQPEFLPTRCGFDHYYGLPYSNDMGRQRRTWAPVEQVDRDFPPLPLLEDEEVIQQQPDQRGLIERYVEQCVRFMRGAGTDPFFLCLAPLQVHLPLYAPERFVAESRNGDFGACVSAVDWALAALEDELRRLGKYEDTLVIFTSDNGSRADHGASNGPLRGAKTTTWEGGQRVPCVVRWPGVTPSGVRCGEIVSNLDFLPIFARLAGVEVPRDRRIDGEDLTEVFLTGRGQGRAEFRYYHMETLEAVRMGCWKLHVYKNEEPMRALYNLQEDPGEQHDLMEQRPEIARRLEQALAAAREDLGCRASGVPARNARQPGRAAHPRKLTADYDPNHPYLIALYDKEEDF